MLTAKLRAVGGSVMVAIPRPLLETMALHADSRVALSVSDGRLVMEPARARYSLTELMARCDEQASDPSMDRAWLDDGPVGREEL